MIWKQEDVYDKYDVFVDGIKEQRKAKKIRLKRLIKRAEKKFKYHQEELEMWQEIHSELKGVYGFLYKQEVFK